MLVFSRVTGVAKNALSQERSQREDNLAIRFEVETTMYKATSAIVSLLFVVSVAAFSHWILPLLAANGIVSGLFLALVLVLSVAGAGLRRGLRRDARGNAEGRLGRLLRGRLGRGDLSIIVSIAISMAISIAM